MKPCPPGDSLYTLNAMMIPNMGRYEKIRNHSNVGSDSRNNSVSSLDQRFFRGFTDGVFPPASVFFISIPFTSFVYILFIFVNNKLTLINYNVNTNRRICY